MFRISASAAHRKSGLTMVEVLVSISIIGLLVALVLPAVQSSRASARRAQCASHLKQIGIAAHSYAEQHQQLPYTHPGAGFLFSLLPHLEQQSEYVRLQTLLLGGSEARLQAFATAKRIETFLCPADNQDERQAASSFAVNRGLPEVTAQLRAFVPDDGRSLSWRDVTDGLSQTALCSERRGANPIQPGTLPDPRYGNWFVNNSATAAISRAQLVAFANDCLHVSQTSPPITQAGGIDYLTPNAGYNHVVPPDGPSCLSPAVLFSSPSISNHAGGVNVLLADGAVRFASKAIDRAVWFALGSRDGNEAASSSF